MKLANFNWLTKQQDMHIRTEDAGRQIVLDFGKYHLSIIDDGYGREQCKYEIAAFDACDGVASGMTELPGITAEGDTVKGWLTESDIDAIIKKMYSITGTEPRQV
jgi:hypothetical protein